MTVSTRTSGDVTIIDFKGRITIGVGDVALRSAVHEALDGGATKILLNLADVTTIDSSGVGELVGSYTTTNNRGAKLALLNLPPRSGTFSTSPSSSRCSTCTTPRTRPSRASEPLRPFRPFRSSAWAVGPWVADGGTRGHGPSGQQAQLFGRHSHPDGLTPAQLERVRLHAVAEGDQPVGLDGQREVFGAGQQPLPEPGTGGGRRPGLPDEPGEGRCGGARERKAAVPFQPGGPAPAGGAGAGADQHPGGRLGLGVRRRAAPSASAPAPVPRAGPGSAPGGAEIR